MTLDPERYRLSGNQFTDLNETHRNDRPTQESPSVVGEPFVPPIPLAWMERAIMCGPSGGTVASAIWYALRVRRESPVRLTRTIRDKFGLGPSTAKRILVRMEQAGLLTVEFHRGRSPRVKVIHPPAAVRDS